MSYGREGKVMDISLKIGGRHKTIQGVTEKTTCGDVIKMVLRKFNNTRENYHRYAIFECANREERMLSDKTRVLKTMRSWNPGNTKYLSLTAIRKCEFVKAKQDKDRRSNEEFNNLDATNKLVNATKLPKFVKTQKTRLQRRHQSRGQVTEIRYNSLGAANVDGLISDVDRAKSLGESVTTNGRVRLSEISGSCNANEHVPSTGFVSGLEIRCEDKINNIKYAVKKVLKPKRVLVAYGHENTGMAKKHTFVDSEPGHIPSHSTPIQSDAKRNLKRHDELAEHITAKVARLDQREGKEVILQKYFSDYISYNSPHRKPFPMPKRERGDGAEEEILTGNQDKGDGAFSTSAPVYNYTTRARRHSDSDSGHEDHVHEENLDNAFICKTVPVRVHCNNKKDHANPLSGKLVNHDVTITTKVDKLVDYSFSDTSVLESFETTVDVLERNIFDEDDEMASFMDSKLHNDSSDEGLSSLDSDDEGKS